MMVDEFSEIQPSKWQNDALKGVKMRNWFRL